MATRTLYWFSNDLRLQNNPCFSAACANSDELLAVFIIDPAWLRPNRYGLVSLGQHRYRFLRQALAELQHQLAARGHELIVVYDVPLVAVQKFIEHCGINTLAQSEQVGWYECRYGDAIARQFPHINYVTGNSHRLLEKSELPFAIYNLPTTFSQFRKLIEAQLATKNLQPTPALTKLPNPIHPPPMAAMGLTCDLPPITNAAHPYSDLIVGGELAAQRHLTRYFSSPLPSCYKAVRNNLDGWQNSSKFSPWLATGALSPISLLHAVREYEARHGANESTYWLVFELLWREYFQWYAVTHGARLFHARGINGKHYHTSFYPQRFQQWCHGTTPYPLVNACMKQLNHTGYLANRNRQIVASCLVNELALDWRYGAAFFEQQLVDYDVASNWGNWQYLAGVGCDPRGKRHFDLDKQAQQFDSDSAYVQQWQGDADLQPINNADAADWPLSP